MPKHKAVNDNDNDENDDDDDSSITSDDALCELLGLQSLDDFKTVQCCEKVDDNDDDNHYNFPLPNQCQSIDDLVHVSNNSDYIYKIIQKYDIIKEYQSCRVCILPNELNIPSFILRQITNEVIYDNNNNLYSNIERIYETIPITRNNKDGTVTELRSTLTRLENLNEHKGWYNLCNHYIQQCVSTVIYGNNNNSNTHENDATEKMILYKTKLNIKPPNGGKGFAPHIDTPSLLIPFGTNGPQHFITVMIAIDDMTIQNGCLRIVKDGSYSTRYSNDECCCCDIIPPVINGNPDSDGRAGAIPIDIANHEMNFDNIICVAGTICIFDGYVPHRSSINKSNFSRRAVFLTYNPSNEGDYYDLYYQRMKQLRNDYKTSSLLKSVTKEAAQRQQQEQQVAAEIEALSTIPRT